MAAVSRRNNFGVRRGLTAVSKPEDRCGHVTESYALDSRGGGNCCWRPAASEHRRCLWHANLDEKDVTDLLGLLDRAGNRLDGASLPGLAFPEGLDASSSTFADADLSDVVLRRADLRRCSFVEATLADADLTECNLSEADFHASDLSDATLVETKLRRANLTEVLAPGINLRKADLKEADFSASDLRDVALTEANLEHASFRGARLWNADLSDADLTVVALSEADLQEANLRGADLSESDLHRVDFRDADLGDSILHRVNLREARMYGATVEQASLAHADLTNGFGEQANFSRADLRDIEGKEFYVPDAVFDQSRLREAIMCRTKAPRASFEGVSAVGIDFTDSDLRDTDFSGSNLQDADLAGADLSGANLVDANMEGADLTGAVLRGATLSEANLDGVTLDNADLHDAEIRAAVLQPHSAENADFTEADLTDSRLHGADFEGAKLVEADLSEVGATDSNFFDVDLEDAVIDGCDLRGADFKRARLHGAWIRDVRLDEESTFGRMCYYEAASDTALEPDIPGREDHLLGEVGSSESYTGRLKLFFMDGRPAISRLRKRLAPGHNLDDEITDLNKAVRVYRTYQRLFRENSLPDVSRRYYVQERHARRKIALSENRGPKWIWLSLQRWSMLYGEGPLKVVFTSLLVVLGFAMLFAGFGIQRVNGGPITFSGERTEALGLGRDLLGFSFRNFLALGGDKFTATGWLELFVLLEAFIGALLIALLVFVLGRRATR